MSEITPEELVEEITYTVDDAEVIPTPVDPTLSIAGEAADAKATGDAIRQVGSNIKVNNKTAVDGNVTVYASDIYMSGESGAQTIDQAVEAVNDRTADDILYETGETDTIKDTVDGFMQAVEDGVTDEEIDAIFDDWDEEEEA